MLDYLLIATTLAGFAFAAYKFAAEKNLKSKINILEQENNALEEALKNLESEKGNLRDEKTQAQTRLESNVSVISQLKESLDAAIKQKEEADILKYEAEKREGATNERLQNMQQQMDIWKKDKETHIEQAKIFVAEATSKLSSDLLDKHKKEADSLKKQSEEAVAKTTAELHGKFQNVFESMGILNDKIKNSETTVDLVKNALLSPGGAGSLAEITLENIFRASGLIEDQDYITQHWIMSEEGGLKPDAVVFLPNDSFIIIDSKASKFYIEIEENFGNQDKKDEFEAGLKRTMNKHLGDLKSRNYKKAIEDEVCKNKSENSTAYSEVLMFLPSDAAIEKLRKIDPSFLEKAWKEQIYPVGPSGLLSHLLMANRKIADYKQFENSQVIISEVKNLLNSVAVIYSHSQGIGKGIKKAFDSYDKFAASFNRSFVAKTRRLEKLGVQLTNNKEIKKLDRFQITATTDIIEGEAVDEEDENINDNEIRKIATN